MAKTQYIYDGFQYLGEADENGTVTKLYVNEPDSYTNLIGEYDVQADEALFHHYDALGSTTEVTDDAGDVTDTFDYDAWGNVLSRTGTNVIPFQYVGGAGILPGRLDRDVLCDGEELQSEHNSVVECRSDRICRWI
jgi:YD repeat-containing protein